MVPDAPTFSSIPTWPPAERPRERLHRGGCQSLSNRELLALLIGSGKQGRTALDIAGSVLAAANGSLRRLAAMRAVELTPLEGVGPAVAARLIAALELGKRLACEPALERPRIRGPADVYDRYHPVLRDLPHEEFHLLLLNTQHGVIRESLVTRGTLDTSIVHPREVFRPAILEGAASVILVHNHPSGDPTPSPDDREVTAQLAHAGRIVGVPIIDHVVVGASGYVSFAEAGFLVLD